MYGPLSYYRPGQILRTFTRKPRRIPLKKYLPSLYTPSGTITVSNSVLSRWEALKLISQSRVTPYEVLATIVRSSSFP